MKIVFFGTAQFAVPILKALVTQHEVVLVVSSPDAKVGRKQEITQSPISEMAVELNLKLANPLKLKNNTEFFEQLKEYQADMFVVVAYGKIIPQEILDIPPKGTINVHGSILPKYRGASPIQYALLNGETETGVTIMVMDKEVDHGPILTSDKLKIEPNDIYLSLSNRLSNLASPLLIKTLDEYGAGKITPQEQNHEQATFTKIISKEDGKINWEKTSQEIKHQLQAFTPWPGIWTTWENQTLKIIECSDEEAINENNNLETGTITQDGKIICGNQTVLRIEKIQLAGKPVVSMADFLRGHKSFFGSKLI